MKINTTFIKPYHLFRLVQVEQVEQVEARIWSNSTCWRLETYLWTTDALEFTSNSCKEFRWKAYGEEKYWMPLYARCHWFARVRVEFSSNYLQLRGGSSSSTCIYECMHAQGALWVSQGGGRAASIHRVWCAMPSGGGDVCVPPGAMPRDDWGGLPGRELFDGCQHSDSYFIKDCMHVFKNVVEYRNIV